MDVDSVSPKSQPLPQTFQIPTLWLPDPLILTPANSRESSTSTAYTEDSWPPKWAPPPARATTPPFSSEDLLNTPLDTPGETPHTSANDQAHPNPPSKWWQPSHNPSLSSTSDPLTNALTNARKTTTTFDALSSLLATLLTAETLSSCGCPTQLPHDPSASTNTNTTSTPTLTDARILQILLPLHPTLDHSPAGVHALHRLCMHGSAIAADDLAALQDQDRDSVSSRRVARFVAKWGAVPERAFEGLEGFDDADTLIPGEAGEISVAGCLDFVAAFASGWAERKGLRVRGVPSGVERLREQLWGGVERREWDGARGSGNREGLHRLVERGRGNIEHVLRLLGHVAAELDGEMRRRAHGAHFLPNACWRLGVSEVEVRVARGEIERVIVEVEKDREALAGWGSGGVGVGIWGGNWDEDGRRAEWKVWVLRRWLRLSEPEGGWGWGLVMRADEIVRRIGVGRWVDFGGGGGEKRLGLRSW